ncbi:MAG: hypothetical protein WC884_00215 [Candidatus Paceibacterota bacterium]
MNKNKVALVVGSFVGLVHLVWGIAIAFGFAQPWINFVFNIHSLNNPFTLMSFDFMRSIGLIIVTFLVGYVVGYVFATIWNKFHQ